MKDLGFASPIKETITNPDHNYGLRPSATISTIEIEATLELKYVSFPSNIRTCMTYKWNGKSIYKVPTNKNPEEELTKQREKMTEEAKKAAFVECFKERLGFTKFNDMVFDELHRPLNV